MNGIDTLPLTLGALVFMISAIVGVVKGYRWLLNEIRASVLDAMLTHEAKEKIWQDEVTRRLGVIEDAVRDVRSEVDRLTGEK